MSELKRAFALVMGVVSAILLFVGIAGLIILVVLGIKDYFHVTWWQMITNPWGIMVIITALGYAGTSTASTILNDLDRRG